MYVPHAFAENRLDVLHNFMRQHSFASVVTQDADGLTASHVPVVLLPQHGQFGALHFHLAKPNPQCRALADGASALVMFHGPHAYISPAWYKSAIAVPTWNYIAVHASGNPRQLDDAELSEHLRQLTTTYESSAPFGWSTDRIPLDVQTKLRQGIVGFEMEITRIEGKWKLGQNRSADDVRGAIHGLREKGNAIANLMSAAADERAQ